MFRGLHYGEKGTWWERKRGELGEAPKRGIGRHGEGDAIRVLAGLDLMLSRHHVEAPADLLLALVGAVYSPLFTGSPIPPRTMPHDRTFKRDGSEAAVYRRREARLASAIRTYRRDRLKSAARAGETYQANQDLIALTREVHRLSARLRRAVPGPAR